jgi:hypothetical protein
LAYVIRTIRLTVDEHHFIDAACAALGYGRSELFQEGLLEVIHQLGIYVGGRTPAAPETPWQFAPRRGEESTSFRVSVSLTPTLNELLGRAAKLVGVSETLFAVGSTLRYIGRLQKLARENEALQQIKLPSQYR